MLVAFLSHFILPNKELKHRNMKLPSHATARFNLYSTCRLSLQLDGRWARNGAEIKMVATQPGRKYYDTLTIHPLAYTIMYCGTGQWRLKTQTMMMITAIITQCQKSKGYWQQALTVPPTLLPTAAQEYAWLFGFRSFVYWTISVQIIMPHDI
jgi:hypothetical protein